MTVEPGSASVTGSTLSEEVTLRQGRQHGRATASTPPSSRWTGCASTRGGQALDHQPGRADRRQPELAEGRPARARRCWKTSSCARRSRTSTTSASPSASCTRAAPARTASSSATSALTDTHPGGAVRARPARCTPVFVRFSTVAGERGSKDTARDVRGFAVKFYTDEGNWDLVGNNMPVFFIQDAMKFPDLVHAVKPEPHHGMPQAAPRARHVLGLRVADAGIDAHADVGDVGPRDSAQLPHDAGLRRAHLPAGQRAPASRSSCKFHWKPLLGTHSLVWDEAVKISGADPDLPPARPVGRDRGRATTPSGSSACRSSPRSRPSSFSFDVLDATKLIPEELVPRDAGGPHGAQPQPRQLLRRDRAGGLLHGAHRPRHRLQQRSAAGRPHPFVRGYADHAAGRPELPRDPDQRAARAGAQQPARRHAPAGDPSRPRVVRAQLARRRLSVPGRRGAGSSRFRANRPSRTRCAASRRSSPTTTRRRRCSSTARRRWSRRTSSRRSASSCRR